MRSMWLLVALGGMLTTACDKTEPKTTPASAVLEAPTDEALALPTAADAGEPGAIPKRYERGREILIGGCRDACDGYKESFHSYIRALASEGGAAASIPFLETSEMVAGGKRLGDGWVELWREGKIAERRESIEQFAAELGAWAAKVEGTDAIERALATGVEYGEDDDPGFLVYFRHPAFEGDDTAPVWRFRLQERGWEWLISEVDMHWDGTR
jgi:hypothetical protein